jgi:hypothetical protein
LTEIPSECVRLRRPYALPPQEARITIAKIPELSIVQQG